MKFFRVVVAAAFAFFTVPTCSYYNTKYLRYLNDEGKLMLKLRGGKYSHLRPVSRVEEIVNVTTYFILMYINDLDLKTGFLSAEMRISMKWNAPDLSWDPKDYDGISKTRLPSAEIPSRISPVWVPDLSMYNGRSGDFTIVKTPVTLKNDGSATWFTNVQLKIPCDLDMQRFPYDSHTCRATFGSWVYNANEIDFHTRSDKLNVPGSPSEEWDVTSSSIKRHISKYQCCPAPYASIELDFDIQRKSTVFAYVYISPMVVMALLCPFMFLLPYQHSQRFTLGGSLMVCLILLLVNLDHVFPTTFSGFPFISIYYMSVIVMLCLAMVSSAIILNLAVKKTKPHPLLKRIFEKGLWCVIFVKNLDSTNSVASNEEGKAEISDEITWSYIAAVLDRFFFILYIIATLVIAIALATSR